MEEKDGQRQQQSRSEGTFPSSKENVGVAALLSLAAAAGAFSEQQFASLEIRKQGTSRPADAEGAQRAWGAREKRADAKSISFGVDRFELKNDFLEKKKKKASLVVIFFAS